MRVWLTHGQLPGRHPSYISPFFPRTFNREGLGQWPWVLRTLCTSLITIGPELASIRAPRPGGGGQALAGAEEGGQVGLSLPTAL